MVFVAIAEEVGLIHRLGELVLTEARLATKVWPIETVAVNVSALELSKAGYAMRVANTLMRTGANPRHLELEVTETTFTAKTGNANATSMHCASSVFASQSTISGPGFHRFRDCNNWMLTG